MTNIENLPCHVLLKILKHIRLDYQKNLALVNKQFHKILLPFFPLNFKINNENIERFQWQYKCGLIQYYIHEYSGTIELISKIQNQTMKEIIQKDIKLIEDKVKGLWEKGDNINEYKFYKLHPLSCPKDTILYELRSRFSGFSGTWTIWDIEYIQNKLWSEGKDILKIEENLDPRESINEDWITEIISWDPTVCMQSYPCCHSITVKCTDGKIYPVRYFYGNQFVKFFKKANKPIPYHFMHLKGDKKFTKYFS